MCLTSFGIEHPTQGSVNHSGLYALSQFAADATFDRAISPHISVALRTSDTSKQEIVNQQQTEVLRYLYKL